MQVRNWVSGLTSWPRDNASLMYYMLILLAVSIPLSEFGMSVAQFLLLGLWAFEGISKKEYTSKSAPVPGIWRRLGNNLSCKFRMLLNNPAAMVVVSLYFLHLIGTLYSSNIPYALKDLRIKLPLLALPIIIATSVPLGKRRLNKLLVFFILAVFSGTMVSMYVLYKGQVTDPRNLSIFISHIRFSLTICFSVLILIYFLVKRTYSGKAALFLMPAGIIWFLIFLLILESVTGIVITIVLGFIFLFYYIFKLKSIPIKLISSFFLLAIIFFSYSFLNKVVIKYGTPDPVELNSLEKYTEFGVPYVHDTNSYGIEKGEYVGLYISQIELRHEWNLRSEFSYDGKDAKGQDIRHTLIRYLHSKGLRKDALAVRSLSDTEIQHIENGIANVSYTEHFNINSRIEQMAMGYHNYTKNGDPNASSVMQRVEYWKASMYIIKNNWLTGVGTGDLNEAFDEAYNDLDSRLQDSFRKRSHNQYLAIFIAFGVFGFLWFIFTLIYPGIKTGKFHNFLYIVFIIIILMSMLTEDTLETQAGATFFAFFNALLLFGCKRQPEAPC